MPSRDQPSPTSRRRAAGILAPLALSLVLGAGLTACGDDDPVPPPPAGSSQPAGGEQRRPEGEGTRPEERTRPVEPSRPTEPTRPVSPTSPPPFDPNKCPTGLVC